MNVTNGYCRFTQMSVILHHILISDGISALPPMFNPTGEDDWMRQILPQFSVLTDACKTQVNFDDDFSDWTNPPRRQMQKIFSTNFWRCFGIHKQTGFRSMLFSLKNFNLTISLHFFILRLLHYFESRGLCRGYSETYAQGKCKNNAAFAM